MYLVQLFDQTGHAGYVAHPGGKSEPGPGSMTRGGLLTLEKKKAFAFGSLEDCRSFLAWFRGVTESTGKACSAWTSVVEEITKPVIPDALPELLDAETARTSESHPTATDEGSPTMELTKTTHQVLHGITMKEFADHLRAAGFHCSEAGEALQSAASGLRFGVFFYGLDPVSARARSMQFLCGMRAQGEKSLAERANKWNRERRFPKLFVDDEGDLVATMDFQVEGVTKDYLSNVLNFWTMALGQMRQEF